jgi:predicted amidophosphoribosyltransferase
VIFTSDKWENGATIQFVGAYHAYRLNNRGKNPKFDWFSGYILDVKESRIAALLYFLRRVDPLVAKDIAICCVPSHDAAKTQSGIRTLGQRLALAGRIDGTSCLIRERTVAKAAHGGERSIQVHLGSIRVHDAELIHAKGVLLVDDVTTTGSSLIACRQLLIEAGAAEVKCLALGETAPHD